MQLSDSHYLSEILDKIGNKLSQSVIDVYLNDFIRYNILDQKTAYLIKVAVSDKSLDKVRKEDRDYVRADIFKCLIVNLI